MCLWFLDHDRRMEGIRREERISFGFSICFGVGQEVPSILFGLFSRNHVGLGWARRRDNAIGLSIICRKLDVIERRVRDSCERDSDVEQVYVPKTGDLERSGVSSALKDCEHQLKHSSQIGVVDDLPRM